MKKLLSIAAVASTLLMAGGDIAPVEPTPVVPEAFTGFYVNGGFTIPQTYLDGEKNFFADDLYNETGLGLGAGVGYVAYNTGTVSVAAELRGAYSIANYDITPFDADTYNYGIYVKPEAYFVDGKLGIYALLGYADVTVEDDFYKESKDGFAYGLGAEYFVTETISVFGDYTMLPDFDVDEAGQQINNDQFYVGVNYRF